jgi:hypothetical protein
MRLREEIEAMTSTSTFGLSSRNGESQKLLRHHPTCVHHAAKGRQPRNTTSHPTDIEIFPSWYTVCETCCLARG